MINHKGHEEHKEMLELVFVFFVPFVVIESILNGRSRWLCSLAQCRTDHLGCALGLVFRNI